MKPIYITAPIPKCTITTIKCKAPRHKRAKRKDVPKEYRRDRLKPFKDQLFYAKQDIKKEFQKGKLSWVKKVLTW